MRLIAKRFSTVLAVAFCALPAPAFAQTSPPPDVREQLKQECILGDSSACVRLRVLNRLGTTREDAITAEGAPMPPADQPKTAASAPQYPPQRAAEPGWSRGKIFMLLLVVNLVGLMLYRLARRPDRAQRVKNRWTAPSLPLPEVLPGPRAEQGNLEDHSGRGRQLFAWDRSRIDRWLDDQIRKVRDKVTNEAILAFYADIKADPDTAASSYNTAWKWLLENTAEDQSLELYWDDVEVRFFLLLRARHQYGSASYTLAGIAQNTDRTNLLPKEVLALWRMAADVDFNPSAVNMWYYVHTEELYEKDWLDPPAMEGYLRYFFRLGAPDGHYHIAAQLLSFYLQSPIYRPDEGYVAAAMERIRHYDPSSYKVYLQIIAERNLPVDLKDQRIPRNGIMFEMSRERALH